MIWKYFRVIHITSEKIIIGNTQSAHDVPMTYPEGPLTGPNVQDQQGIFRKLSGHQYKNWFIL